MASEIQQPSYSKGYEKEAVPSDAVVPSCDRYQYSHLRNGDIRLLQLLPHRDKTHPIQCELFDYPLQELSKNEHHLYDALSYVWGSSEKPQSISIDNCDLPVTINLYAALLRLRDPYFKRVIWVDAICINQKNKEERGRQVQTMTMIYASASRVIIWLGQSEADSEKALEEIYKAADKQPNTRDSQIIQPAVLELLQRPWFKRIWVLQEVAAARNILILCGSMEIDGYTFCLGMNYLQPIFQDQLDLQSFFRPATYLMQRRVFRPKNAISEPGRLSLNICSLAELIDMYHTREASDRHDKIYALLGMSSDGYSLAGLSPNYNTPWSALFQKVIKFILGKQVFTMTWNDKEMAIIMSKGYALGEISSVESNNARNDRLSVIISKYTSTYVGQKEKENWNSRWTLQASAKSIQKGDIVCLLHGASKPLIARLQDKYFTIIAIAVTPIHDNQEEGGKNDWSDILQSITDFPHDFLLIWDWNRVSDCLENKTNEYWINDQVLQHGEIKLGSCLMNVGLILKDLKNYEKAAANIERAIEQYKQELGDEHSYTLEAMKNLALIYEKLNRFHEAWRLEVIADLLGQRGKFNENTEHIMAEISGTCDQDVMTLLLNRRGSEAIITERVIQRAAGNVKHGKEVMALLLEHRGDQITITKEVVRAATDHNAFGKEHTTGEGIITLLLNWRRNQITITQEAVVIIAGEFNKDVMALLLDRRGDQISITEEVIEAAAGNWKHGKGVMALLLDQRGDQISITEEVIEAAAGNRKHGKEMMALLLDRRGDQISITEEVIKAAVKNHNTDKEMLVLLLNHRGDQILIAEDIIKAAAENLSNGEELLALLLNQQGIQVILTEEAVTAVKENYKFGNEIMKLLLNHRSDEITITEDSVCAIAARFSMKILTLLLKLQGDQMIITDKTVSTITKMSNGEIMTLLLNKRGHQIIITENVLVAAAENKENAGEVMVLLFDRRGEDIAITEKVMRVAARNTKSGAEVMGLLLDRRGDQIIITEEIVKAAARNRDGKETLKFLFNQRGSQITVTEEIVKAAARSWNGKEKLEFLLNLRGDQIIITEEIMKAATGNKKDVIALLLDWRGDQIIITEEIVKAAARSWDGREILELLLNLQGSQIIITEEIVKAAARSWDGREILELLLNLQGSQITITEEIVKAAAGSWNGKEKLEFLLNLRGSQITITEEIVKAAAGNKKDVIALLFNRRKDQIVITEEIVKAAARSWDGKGILEFLLNLQGSQITITEEIVKAAAGNKKDVIALLFNRRKDQIVITEEIVKAAATNGQDSVLDLLCKQEGIIFDWDKWRCISKFYNAARDGDVSSIGQLIHKVTNPDIKNNDGQTPLWIAAKNGHEGVVKFLAQRMDVNVNSLALSRRSPLFWASARGYERTVTILVEAGADPCLVDVDGWTAVTIARQNGYGRVTEILERVG